MISRRHLPSATCVRLSQRRSRCQFHWSGVAGSKTDQKNLTNAASFACSPRRCCSIRVRSSRHLRNFRSDEANGSLQLFNVRIQFLNFRAQAGTPATSHHDGLITMASPEWVLRESLLFSSCHSESASGGFGMTIRHHSSLPPPQMLVSIRTHTHAWLPDRCARSHRANSPDDETPIEWLFRD